MVRPAGFEPARGLLLTALSRRRVCHSAMSAFVIVSLMHLAPPHEDSSKCDDVTMISHSDDALTDYPKDTVGVVADCWI